MPPNFKPDEFAFELLAVEFSNMVRALAKTDYNATSNALDEAEQRVAAHLYSTAERLGEEPDWLVASASSLRKAIDLARGELTRKLQ